MDINNIKSLIPGRKTQDQLQAMQKELKTLQKTHKKMVHVQAGLVRDILSMAETSADYKGNAYKDYKDAVEEISDKYCGIADWGVLQTANIIEVRTAFITGQGIKVVHKTDKKSEATKEIEWANDFLEYNGLDKEMPGEFHCESEIEGKFLGILKIEEIPEESPFKEYKKIVSMQFVPWSKRKYEVTAKKDDYTYFEKVVWKEDDSADKEFTAGSFTYPDFVYRKFGGRVDQPNDPAPKIMKCLTQIDNIDKGLRDWREINRLYGSPTPHIECETPEQAKKMNEMIEGLNFKVKKFFAHTGKFAYATPDMQGADSIEKEIIRNAVFVSGTTGIPIHYLGLAELLKQVATADDLREFVNTSTSKDRIKEEAIYREIIKKAMIKWNSEVVGQMSDAVKLDPDKIDVVIPVISREQWLNLEKVIMPAVEKQFLSEEYFRSQIPGLDTETEEKRLKKAKESDFQRIKKENADLVSKVENKDLGIEEEEE